MKKINVRIMAEIAICAAIGFVLDIFQGGIFRGVWFNGGGIGISMVPVFIIAYRRGLIPGVLCGLILSLINMLGGIYVINSGSLDGWRGSAFGVFMQVGLDYVITYPLVGLAGCFTRLYKKSNTKGMKITWVLIGSLFGGLLKFISHLLSGGLFWLNSGNKFMGVVDSGWLYSFVYNISYMLPSIILSTIIMVLIARFYPILLNPDKQNITEETKEEEGSK